MDKVQQSPNAQVELTSESTHISRTTKSSASGEYILNAVSPGTYMLTVASPGFATLTRNGIIVDSGNTIPVDLKLEIGSASNTVVVNASEPLVNNGTSYNGQIIDSEKLTTPVRFSSSCSQEDEKQSSSGRRGRRPLWWLHKQVFAV